MGDEVLGAAATLFRAPRKSVANDQRGRTFWRETAANDDLLLTAAVDIVALK